MTFESDLRLISVNANIDIFDKLGLLNYWIIKLLDY